MIKLGGCWLALLPQSKEILGSTLGWIVQKHAVRSIENSKFGIVLVFLLLPLFGIFGIECFHGFTSSMTSTFLKVTPLPDSIF